jgi:8-oxo-dGTP pyrophosphatase MutT (NUDIX family)
MPQSSLVERVRRQLLRERALGDPRARVLANVDGPVSPALLEALDQPSRAASVLLALIARGGDLTVLFTERAAHLKDHAGQISLPGGRLAPGETAVEAALREASEEVGLVPEAVSVLGCMDVHLTVTGFAVTPVVGYVPAGFEPQLDPLEVASAFEVPLDVIRETKNIQVAYRERFGTRFRTYELHYGGHRIWGATAAMLVSFVDTVFDEKTI